MGRRGYYSVNHTQVPSCKVLSEHLSPGVSRTVLKFFSSHRETRSSPSSSCSGGTWGSFEVGGRDAHGSSNFPGAPPIPGTHSPERHPSPWLPPFHPPSASSLPHSNLPQTPATSGSTTHLGLLSYKGHGRASTKLTHNHVQRQHLVRA